MISYGNKDHVFSVFHNLQARKNASQIALITFSRVEMTNKSDITISRLNRHKNDITLNIDLNKNVF